MLTSFSTALSALNATAAAVNVIGNNLANLNTSGFKASSLSFQDLISQSLGATADGNDLGLGVGPIGAVRQFRQGAIQTTGGAFDAAIEGDGFFVARDQNSQTLFTRAGNFRLDANGNLVTAGGQNVQGWSAANGVLDTSSPVGNIRMPVGSVVPATASTRMGLDVNLNAASAKDAAFSAPIQVVDSQGGTHVLTVAFKKTDVNKWSYTVTIPAADLKSGGTTSLATGDLSFDATGQLTSPAAGAEPVIKIAGLADGASDMSVTWELFKQGGQARLTQFAQSSGVSAVDQNGTEAGQIVKVGLADGGLVIAQYSNGQQATVAQLAVASIRNPETMSGVGENNLQATGETAAAAIGAAGSGGRGKIAGGSLEASTVDIASEFTQLITMQRSYQANSRVITATDELLQETLNLTR